MSIDREKFAHNLRAYREKKGISQTKLSEITGIAGSTIRGYENAMRNPRTSCFELLAEALGITVDELLNGDPEKKTPVEHPPANAQSASMYRPCLVDGKPALFHCWDTQEFAVIVEYQDGTAGWCSAGRIRFLDTAEQFAKFDFGEKEDAKS